MNSKSKAKLLLGIFLISGLFSQISNFSIIRAEGDKPSVQVTKDDKEENKESAAPTAQSNPAPSDKGSTVITNPNAGVTELATKPQEPAAKHTKEENQEPATPSTHSDPAPSDKGFADSTNPHVNAVKRPRSPYLDDARSDATTKDKEDLIEFFTTALNRQSHVASNKELYCLNRFVSQYNLHTQRNFTIDESEEKVTIIEAAVIKNRKHILAALLRRINLTRSEVDRLIRLAQEHTSSKALDILLDILNKI